ncbi:MAG: exodeoxyribonuclease VII small subunit [Kiritimatiellaeota bacterium]|nr:exodeoxyribonuclease VII small subunit [Kiritimatiellota bacterium]
MSEKNEKKNPENFEAAMRRLEVIVDEMESGHLGLEDMIKAFEEGRGLAAYCGGQLAAIEKRIEMLVESPDGQVSAAPFDKRENPK